MTKKWIPITGIFYCPGKMSISADELGITIGVGNRALATTEWPNESIRLCETAEEPTPQQQGEWEPVEDGVYTDFGNKVKVEGSNIAVEHGEWAGEPDWTWGTLSDGIRLCRRTATTPQIPEKVHATIVAALENMEAYLPYRRPALDWVNSLKKEDRK